HPRGGKRLTTASRLGHGRDGGCAGGLSDRGGVPHPRPRGARARRRGGRGARGRIGEWRRRDPRRLQALWGGAPERALAAAHEGGHRALPLRGSGALLGRGRRSRWPRNPPHGRLVHRRRPRAELLSSKVQRLRGAHSITPRGRLTGYVAALEADEICPRYLCLWTAFGVQRSSPASSASSDTVKYSDTTKPSSSGRDQEEGSVRCGSPATRGRAPP